MNAIVPLNVAALRVSANDHNSVTPQFKGRTAVFDQMPTRSGASTGDKIYRPLETSGTTNPLGVGVHVHWELPDYFRRGTQPAEGGNVVFPAAPNRWLVVRYFSQYDGTAYGPVSTKTWLVESDYVAPTLPQDADGTLRPATAVPLTPPGSTQPYMWMGRVLDYDAWNPASTPASNYLPAFNGPDGKPLYLSAVGFVGPAFAGYYPECPNVFGFWDRFDDLPDVYKAINANQPALQFRVTYQVIGWLADPTTDPLAGLPALIEQQYATLLTQWNRQQIAPTQTPADVFAGLMQQRFSWNCRQQDVAFTLNPDNSIQSLEVPTQTLCAGQMQELVWNMLATPSNTGFLGNPAPDAPGPGIWTDSVEVAVGNTTIEALSARLKQDLGQTTTDPDLLKNYEYLLNAFQLGLLPELESDPNSIFDLEETLHSRDFARSAGGRCWVIKQDQPASSAAAPDPGRQVTLPLPLAEQLFLLNQAQKNYDQGRALLDTMRKQLFMDWLRYLNLYTGAAADYSHVTLQELSNFLSGGSTSPSELRSVVAMGTEVGLLHYQQAPNGEITGPVQPIGTTSQAALVWQQYKQLEAALQAYPSWRVQSAPAAPFWQAADPVVLMEGPRIEPVRRNGRSAQAPVRLNSEVLDTLAVAYNGQTTTLAVSSLKNLPLVNEAQPQRPTVQSLVGEAYLLTPMLAEAVAATWPGQAPAQLAAGLAAAQGGQSPLDAPAGAGLFAAVRQDGYQPAANPQQSITAPLTANFTFTNTAGNGWAPSAVAWSSQQQYSEFNATHYDPFLPTHLIWSTVLKPLRRNDAANLAYDAANLTQYFQLDEDGIDYLYASNGSQPPGFVQQSAVTYSGAVVLSKKPTISLTDQINQYIKSYPDDEAVPALRKVAEAYDQRHLMSQALSGFSTQQTLRAYLPKVAVQDLAKGSRDAITTQLNQQALTANPGDNWYDFGFNGQAPIATGLQAQLNFGPLRAGFAEISSLEIVDVFGQRMQLRTAALNPDGTLQATAAQSLQPLADDSADAGQLYLPPRLLTPTRLWFRWLSARFDAAVSGIAADFVEMNSHPATSPVCGWVLPNHLDNSLFLYDDDGTPIGSFGLEHGASVYRTRAANLQNPSDSLAADIGPETGPAFVNPHVAQFMWYVNQQGAGFLTDLMATIQNSEPFLNPAGFAQDAGLAVLIGRPLALTRAVLALETSGGVLPCSQADTTATDAFPQDVQAMRVDYTERQQHSSAALGEVTFPLRLGELAKTNDGLVAFLPEKAGPAPYQTLYAPAAPAAGQHGVVRPAPDTLQLTLNAPPRYLTLLIDPRAAVHATTGVLPVETLQIPPDQYAQTMRSLAVTFFTHPVLRRYDGLVVPLPAEAGYDWSWVQPLGNLVLEQALADLEPLQPLPAQAGNDVAAFGYTPQLLLEGWLQLKASPPPAEEPIAAPPTGPVYQLR